ncbi:hypothetical protein EUX98_g7397 [Antrodiella citrinella]|uniref:Uncharacterized protein n=1 Tax=Antrodiella citrinella TaxID=2447956 RepID=A0A4S4MU01_9APHY|nr:hypothetical protein EUX98_g7397 [Antrodiella citrinella]
MRLLDSQSLGLLVGALCVPWAVSATPSATTQASVPFFTPTAGGGSFLTNAGDGFGEPLNVIISALSSPAVLTVEGIINFGRALNFTTQCGDLTLGGYQSANLGDGNGYVNQTILLRESYGNAILGACLESFIGGDHFRVFTQNGTKADSGALFLAASHEENLTLGHDIGPNGYDGGRDDVVNRATGITSFGGVTYNTTALRMLNATAAGSQGVNHGIAIDGTVVLLTVTIQ